MQRRVAVPIALLALGLACTPNVNGVATTSVSGVVVAGPVSASRVAAFTLNARGQRGKEVATATSAADGTFTIDLGSHFGPTLVCASGGTFAEEATGGLVDVGANELCALVDDAKIGEATTGVVITPFTSLHAGLTACLTANEREPDLPSASLRASARLNEFLGQSTPGFNLRTTPTFDTTASIAPSLTADVWHGVLLAGLSESARQISVASNIDPGVRVTSATMTTQLVRDIDDQRCVFDGKGPGDVALEQGVVALSSQTLRGAPQGLARGVETFLRDARNKSGVTPDAVKDLIDGLGSFTSDIFDDQSTSPPSISFVEPAAGTVSGKPAIVVSAHDGVDLADVVFVSPDLLVGTGTKTCESAKSCELHGVLNTGLFAAGPLTITARATNAAGVSADATVEVTVNNALPTIEVASPSPGTLSGTVALKAAAASAAGITSFDVDVPGATFLQTCNPPAVTTDCDRELDPNIIDILWDTTQVAEGPHTLTFAATDTAGNTSFNRVDVVVNNIAAGTVAGVVELGYPVVGAQVTVFETSDGTRGATIGTAVTDDHGRYQLVNADYEGAIEVVATGGTFVDPATGLTLSLRAGQELTAAIADVAAGQAVVANVNAWTTIALARALGRAADSPSFSAAVEFNSNLVASHFLRPGSLSLTSAASADLLTQAPAVSDSAAILALAHAGLSRLAAQASIDGGGAPGQVTPADVLGVLEDDVADGVLDGTSDGTALFLDAQTVAMDSYTLRTTLADRIDAFVKNAPLVADGDVVLAGTRNAAATITSTALAGPGLLYDDLAEDRSILFPSDLPTRPFDHTPPTVSLAFAAPNQAVVNGGVLTGTVAITGVASDQSGVSSFDVVSPGVTDLFSSVEDLRVEIDGSVAPNRLEVSSECGIDITEPPLSLPDAERQVCLCVEASDAVANVTDDALCFTRPRPTVTIGVDGFIGPALSRLAAHAEGSFDLRSCSTTLRDGANAMIGSGFASGTDSTCDVNVLINGPLASGPANLDVAVTEIGGAVTAAAFPLTVDVDAPTVAVTAPAAGAVLVSPPVVTAAVGDANLRAVTLDVTTSSTPVVSGLLGTSPTAGIVAFPAFADTQPDGLRTIKVTAVDAAGNTSSASRTYTKDTTPPALVALGAADGNPLAFFQLTATTGFTPSAECSQFPFSGCVFNIASSTMTQSVPLRTQSTTVDTYRRWQHLAGAATNPSTLAQTPAENRAPTLRLKTDPAVAVEARVDSACPLDNAFSNRSRATFTANNLGLVDIPIVDANNLTATTLLREQLGDAVLCLSMRPRDQAGNAGAIVHHFFKYEATPAPLHMVFNAGPYDPASFVDDVGSLDNGHDDKALSGAGQGTAGRVFSHAYLVSPSTSTSYNYSYKLNDGTAPTIKVKHRETLQISKTRAFNWCFTRHNGALASDSDDQLVNPDHVNPDAIDSAPDEPHWFGDDFIDRRSANASWALWVPQGTALLGAIPHMEHSQRPSGEQDTTVGFSPASSYPTSSNTTQIDLEHTFTIPLDNVTLDAWTFNTVTGQPNNLLSSGSTVTFTAGGSSASSRNVLILFRAPVPSNAVTLKTASALDAATSTLGFNSSCDARNSAGTIVSQAFRLADQHWVISDAAIPGSTVEPAAPHPLFWVASGQFPYCDGTSPHDCRYGRYFDDYETSTWAWAAGRSLSAKGRVGAVHNAPLVPQVGQAVPATNARVLSQEQ